MTEVTKHPDNTLWYQRPAEHWFDGFPLGNGRMGAMAYGGARVERLYLSETTFWSGEPSHKNSPANAPAIFRQVRQLALTGELVEANQLARQLEGRKLNYGTNLPFGNLRLMFDHEELSERNYRRELNLDEALVKVHYQVGNAVFQREIFVSAAHQVLVVRLTCSQPRGLTLRVALDGDEQPYQVDLEDNQTLVMANQARETQHSDGLVGVDGHARMRVLADGGTVQPLGAQMVITGADAVTILLAMGTTFGGNAPVSVCEAQILTASALPYSALRDAHIQEHQGWFRRCTLDLGANPHPDWPLDHRIDAARMGKDDPNLAALLFQFGRYMILGSSRPNSPLPAHLTGAWNDNKACRIGWTCDYHLDINTQMNYWVTELSGLGECQQPLFNWLEKTLVPSGRETARMLYDLPGWVAHIFSNAWGFSAWGWSIAWGVFPTGGVWAAMHLWDHYRFSGDRAFLAEKAYPILKEAAEFCLAFLVEDLRTGWLVSGPANSPENNFRFQGKTTSMALGPTVDQVLMAELFDACIQAGQLLGVDGDFSERLAAARARLAPYQIGKHGQVQEWLEDYEEATPGHRHTSHLLGLYPFAQITPQDTPELARAARVSIERRISAPDYEEGAWARNNITLFYARLRDGEAAYQSLMTLFRKEAGDSLMTGPRLAPAHAYEMDYNTGAAAGIAEMLLQSHRGSIALLPALPAAWPAGQVRGLRARGGFEVSIQWAGGQLVEAQIRSNLGGLCQLEDAASLKVYEGNAQVMVKRLANEVIAFDTRPGVEYQVRRTA